MLRYLPPLMTPLVLMADIERAVMVVTTLVVNINRDACAADHNTLPLLYYITQHIVHGEGTK